MMRAVNGAWAVLGDPARRAAYDLSLVDASSGTEPREEPRRAPTDADDLLADLADDAPVGGVGGVVVLPRWMSLVPVAAFVGSIGLFGLGMTFGSSPAIAAALGLFLLSCTLFLAAPFAALLSSRRPRS
jgi:curved DNA-binding protein CbpA